MKVTKENRVLVYKANSGKLDIYINVNGVQFKSKVFPNVEEDYSVRSWGGNLYDNVEDKPEEKIEWNIKDEKI